VFNIIYDNKSISNWRPEQEMLNNIAWKDENVKLQGIFAMNNREKQTETEGLFNEICVFSETPSVHFENKGDQCNKAHTLIANKIATIIENTILFQRFGSLAGHHQ